MEHLQENKAYLAFRKRRRKFDFILIGTIFALCILGLVVLSSATLSSGSGGQVKKQAFATVLGFGVMFFLMIVDYRIWKKLYLPIYGICILLLTAVLIIGVGDTTWGSRSWISIGRINFQPAEFVKVGLILSLATFMEKVGDINNPINFLKVAAFALLPVALIMKQPDLGTAVVFLVIIAVMFFFAGLSWKVIFSAVGILLISLPVVFFSLKDFQKNRIRDFLNPEANKSGTGWQYYEGRIAIGSGKITGKGLYKGTQTQYNFIPTKDTDSIFPVLVEELGFIGGMTLLSLYGLMLYRIMEIGRQSKDMAARSITHGIMALFFVHIWENIGMNLGLMPITGIPLPFMSYGGTFQLVNLACIGLVLSIRYHRK